MSGRYLTEDEIDTKIAGGGGGIECCGSLFYKWYPR